MATTATANATNRQFIAIPANVPERMKIAKLSSCARDLYLHLCKIQNFKAFDSRTYPRSDAKLASDLGYAEETIRKARTSLVKNHFVDQNWHQIDKQRVIGTRIFYINFDFAPPRHQKPKQQTIDFQPRFREKASQESGRPHPTFSEPQTPSVPLPEPLPTTLVVAALDTRGIDTLKDPTPPGSPPNVEIYSLWNEKRGEVEAPEVFFPDLSRTLEHIQIRHTLSDVQAVEVFKQVIQDHVTCEIGRPCFYVKSLEGQSALRKAVKKQKSLSLATSSAPTQAEETTENEKPFRESSDTNVSRPAPRASDAPRAPRPAPVEFVEEGMARLIEARARLVKSDLATAYTDAELASKRTVFERQAREMKLKRREKMGAIRLDGGLTTGKDFAQGVSDVLTQIGRGEYAEST
jgi:hypothetical protein